MSFLCNLILNAYSIAILVIIFLQTARRTERNQQQHKLFISMLLVTLLLLIVDILSRFDGRVGWYYAALNQIGNFTIFLLSPLLPSLWLLYVCCHVCRSETRLWTRFLIFLNLINIVILVLSQFFNWLYSINTDNIYNRGPLFWLPVTITAILVISAYILMIRHRKSIDKKHFISLLMFPIPSIICVILQILHYGISLINNGAALSILIAFVSLQNVRINTDFLTGVYNRKGLETYIRQKIDACSQTKSFSGILLDLDDFKPINDTFGHITGDEVLVTAVRLVESCLRSCDFVARYGGDEFVVILSTTDPDELEQTAAKIRDCIHNYHEDRIAPLKLDVSMGYAVYDYDTNLNAEKFLRQLDAIMYCNKRTNKDIQHTPKEPSLPVGTI